MVLDLQALPVRHLQQYNTQRFYAGAQPVLGRKWTLPDSTSLRKFYTTIEESPPNSELRKFQLKRTQQECLFDFRKLTRPPRVFEYAYRMEGTEYLGTIPWTIHPHSEPATIDKPAVTGPAGGCLPPLVVTTATFGRPVEETGGHASSSTEVVATPAHGTAPAPVRHNYWADVFNDPAPVIVEYKPPPIITCSSMELLDFLDSLWNSKDVLDLTMPS